MRSDDDRPETFEETADADLLLHVIDASDPDREQHIAATEALLTRGYAADRIHGDITQALRERTLRRFREGTVEPWEVRPYATWQLDEMDAAGSSTISGAAYDPATGRVFVTERYGEQPVVHVYRITVPGG